jgi:hypothetical protein
MDTFATTTNTNNDIKRTKSHGERILDAPKPRRAHQSQIRSIVIIVLLFGRHIGTT